MDNIKGCFAILDKFVVFLVSSYVVLIFLGYF